MTDKTIQADSLAIYSFKKRERLNSKIAIDALFTIGASHSFTGYPLRIVYRFAEEGTTNEAVEVLVNVPKRNFKKAVDRNLLRRRIKEAYRLHKAPLIALLTAQGIHLQIALLYVDKKTSDYTTIETAVVEILTKLSIKLNGTKIEK